MRVSDSCDQLHERQYDEPLPEHPDRRLIADRTRDLAHKKTQAEIASEASFPNANMMPFLKNGRKKVQIDRVPSQAKALEVDAAYLQRLALDQAVGATAAKATTDIFGTPATGNERGSLQERRDASDNSDPRISSRSRATLRSIFGKRARRTTHRSSHCPQLLQRDLGAI